jgi:hypothetical protein
MITDELIAHAADVLKSHLTGFQDVTCGSNSIGCCAATRAPICSCFPSRVLLGTFMVTARDSVSADTSSTGPSRG